MIQTIEGSSEQRWREQVEVELREALGGSYNAEGIARWFNRPRAQLGNKTPRQVLLAASGPDDPGVERVRHLAWSLAGLAERVFVDVERE
jgi:hypothetical protein